MSDTPTLFDDESVLDEARAKERIEALRREIEHHTYLYYAKDAPEISRCGLRFPHARIARPRTGSSAVHRSV